MRRVGDSGGMRWMLWSLSASVAMTFLYGLSKGYQSDPRMFAIIATIRLIVSYGLGFVLALLMTAGLRPFRDRITIRPRFMKSFALLGGIVVIGLIMAGLSP